MARLDEVRERAEKAHRHISDLAAGREKWTMRIPAQPDGDSDLVISNALADVPWLLERIEALEAGREVEQTALRNAIDQIAAVRKLHQPEARWQHHPDAEWSYRTREEAEWSYRTREEAVEQDEDEGGDGSNVTHFLICRHCGYLETWMAREDDLFGWGYRDSLWPCATIRAIDGEGSE